ncbi:MAG: hypothetical protein QW743_00625 [Candidatus Methanomethylicia archaeon]
MQKPTITIEEFNKLDIRVCRVIEAERIPGKQKLLKLLVDLGPLGTRTIIAGGGEHYNPEDYKGKLFIAIINLQPKTIAGIKSEGMLLAADQNGKPIWLTTISETPPGTIIR